MSQLACLRCKQQIDSGAEQCPHCGERVTHFQRTYSSRLLDGKYQILDRLGVGGMGEIFKVRHIHLNELRVIKIMRPNVAADDQGLQRFLQEARTSTMIKHKNLAMLYDFAQLDDGSYYMVWEFIDGTNIQRWISDNGPMPPRLTIEISIQALHGLDHLHSMGLIHRDISPENIMLSQDHHGKLLVKVIDFGIAKQLAEGESGGHGLTQTGMFLGKLKYASPEQAGFLKEGEHLDPRSDLYSFGVLMYEMLAGKTPFTATNPHGYILKHVTEKPIPIAEMNPAVKIPPKLEEIVMRSLEKSRDARHATAGDFATDLEAIRNSIPPDPKYGLGEKMITLSGARTLAELPKMTGNFTAPGSTQPGRAQATMGDAATVIEKGITPTTLSGAPTVAERKMTIGSDEATIAEHLGPGGAAPTVREAKVSFKPEEAAATVIERQIAPPAPAKKPKVGLIAAGIGALVVAIAAGVIFLKKDTSPQTAVVSTAGTSANVTGLGPATSTQGALLLSASPWGDIEEITNAQGTPVTFPEEARSTPTRIELAPGNYSVTLAGPEGKKTTVDVAIAAGKPTTKNVDMATVDFDALTKEIRP